MRKSIFIATLLLLSVFSFAQNNPRPSKSRFWNNKYSTFQVRPGDILVYEVNDSGDVYNFIATVKKYGDAISFDFSVPKKNIKGNALISAAAVTSATVYDNDFTNANKNLKDKITVWLSKDNYRGLASDDKETKMDFGDGLETFTRESNSTLRVKYKGLQKIMTIHKIASTGASGRKEISVLTDLDNPLIVSMNLGWKVTLKEVR